MFTYDFRCKECECEFEVVCDSEERNSVWNCFQCGSQHTKRLFTTQRHFNKGAYEQKGDAYWENAEKNRVKNQKKRFAVHSEKYRNDKEYRLKENKLLHSRGIPKTNLPDGDLI